ncbi:hypothetical protein I302_100876 [Kwoniella bestiolae CBS 10118]|uniref:Store-operated calcium entry-associated regulatory factor n=1 Tax=Kwoniella bestiolae CBS 10118 TaxID=1296100 RepID=A0AAJ8M4W6_9TREE
MPSHKKIALKSIKTLTFYADKLTHSRRVDPIPQLSCVGSACDLYQPEVVQCTNMGDDGFGGVQWSCDTDLPSSLRLGKVDVSCEGWSKSGDMNVLQGSCGLTYNLNRVNRGLEYGEDPYLPFKWDSLFNKAFNILFYLISFIILYSLLRSLIQRFSPGHTPPRISRFFPFLGGDGPGGGGPGGGGGGGGGPGFNPGSGAPPPPYTKHPTPPPSTQNQSQNQSQGWSPGFWTGLAAGGLGTYLANSNNQGRQAQRNPYEGMTGARNRFRRFDDEDDSDNWDRGVGSSRRNEGLGEMRRATGFGGSSTR